MASAKSVASAVCRFAAEHASILGGASTEGVSPAAVPQALAQAQALETQVKAFLAVAPLAQVDRLHALLSSRARATGATRMLSVAFARSACVSLAELILDNSLTDSAKVAALYKHWPASAGSNVLEELVRKKEKQLADLQAALAARGGAPLAEPFAELCKRSLQRVIDRRHADPTLFEEMARGIEQYCDRHPASCLPVLLFMLVLRQDNAVPAEDSPICATVGELLCRIDKEAHGPGWTALAPETMANIADASLVACQLYLAHLFRHIEIAAPLAVVPCTDPRNEAEHDAARKQLDDAMDRIRALARHGQRLSEFCNEIVPRFVRSLPSMWQRVCVGGDCFESRRG